MTACSIAVEADKNEDHDAARLAHSLYINCLSAVRLSIQDAQRAQEDETLVATMLLCIFEV